MIRFQYRHHFFQKLPNYLIRFVVLCIASVVAIFDLLTLPVYFLWQKPWRRWPLMFRHRSVPDPAYPAGQIVRQSIKQLPKHFLTSDECCTIDEAFEKALRLYGPDHRCLAYRKVLGTEPGFDPVSGQAVVKYDLSDYQWMTWRELMDSIARFGHGLRLLTRTGKGDRVTIYAETSYRWFIAAQAIIKNGSILTTLYSTLGNQGVQEAIRESGSEIMLTTRALLTKLVADPGVSGKLSNIKTIVLLDIEQETKEDEDFIKQKKLLLNNNNPNDIEIYSYGKILGAGSADYFHFNPVKNDPDELVIIMYTSGSGGQPKGVLMTHRNLFEGFKGCLSLIRSFMADITHHVYIGYLPLAHILEFCTETMVLLIGIQLGYSSPATLTDMSPGLKPGVKGDITLLQPTVMTAVPLVLDRIRKAILTRLNQRGLIAVKLFEYIVEYKTFWMSKGFDTPILDRVFLRKFRQLMGGRMEAVLVGGAPLAADTQKWIRACLNVIFSQGYGATETVAGGLFMDEHDFSLAKVGGPLHGTKIRLVDWPEGGYTAADRPNPRGEIHLSSKSLSVGYFQLKHLDSETYYEENGDRWFRTGDIGEMFPNGTFKIIDRKRDFIKLQFGEYVSLGKIETKLKTSYLVNQICVIGDPLRKFLFAIVVPNPKAIERIHTKIGLIASPDNGYENPKLKKIFQRKMTRHARRNGLRLYEIPRHYLLVGDEWTPENGLVTASFKLKRKQVEHYYQGKIEDLFNKLE